jgi:tetratricopeptide (TPR) repeat protein
MQYTTGVWHYTRGLAYTGKGRLDSAAVEHAKLVATAKQIPADAAANLNSVQALLAIAGNHLQGEMAARKGRSDEAAKHLRNAIAGEDELTYDEPPPWYMPIRYRLGMVMIDAGQPIEAEKAFREDLVRRPENGWSLRGLAMSLHAQKRTKEATAAEERFRRAWQHSTGI